jgi:hypothetical protein
MRIGIVLTMTFNLPLKAIESADVLRVKKHQGNIALKVENSTKIAFFTYGLTLDHGNLITPSLCY